jgi:hypothetical protein
MIADPTIIVVAMNRARMDNPCADQPGWCREVGHAQHRDTRLPYFLREVFYSGSHPTSGVPYAERDALRRSVTKPPGAGRV